MKMKTIKYELTISPKYVSSWNVWDALREIMQNTIDRKNENDLAKTIVRYYDNHQRLIIGNEHSSLEKKSLIMGETTKTNNANAIGEFGEGYKLALIILLRNGISVKIRTGNEVWIPVIEYSDKYSTDILVIRTKETKFSENLLYELNNISKDYYNELNEKCLYLKQPTEVIKTDIGDIIKDERYRKKLFVEGLYVCDLKGDKIKFGYNMKSAHIELDRDRNKIDSFNLWWEIGRIYASLDSTYASFIHAMEVEKFKDTEYYSSHAENRINPLYQAMCTLNYNDFFIKYGKKAIPVKTTEEANFVKEKYNDLEPIIVEKKVYDYITLSSSYAVSTKANLRTEETPYSICKDFMKRNKKIMSKAVTSVFKNQILEKSRNWCKR